MFESTSLPYICNWLFIHIRPLKICRAKKSLIGNVELSMICELEWNGIFTKHFFRYCHALIKMLAGMANYTITHLVGLQAI